MKNSYIFIMEISVKRLDRASHIPDTHGRCVNMTAYLMESLNLQSADKRHHRICGGVIFLRNKTDRK